MNFGTIVTLGSEGPVVFAERMMTIGVSDGSHCWACWFEGKRVENQPTAPQLIVSPVPYNRWLDVVRFEFRLSNKTGALHRLADFLIRDPENINVISTRATLSGSRHATWTVLAHKPDVSPEDDQELERFVFSDPDPDRREAAIDKRKRLLAKKASAALSWAYSILAKVHRFNRKSLVLHERFSHPLLEIEIGARPLREYKDHIEKILADCAPLVSPIESLVTPSVKCSLLPILQTAWLYRRNWPPADCMYRASTDRIVPREVKRYVLDARNMRVKLPSRAVASFHPRSSALRLTAIPPEAKDRQVAVVVDYTCSFEPDPTVTDEQRTTGRLERTTSGFIAAATKVLADRDINLLHLSSRALRKTWRYEEGRLRFFGQADHADTLKGLGSDMERAILKLSDKDRIFHPVEVKVKPLQLARVFLSHHFDTVTSLEPALREELKSLGIELVVAKSSMKQSTDWVFDHLRSCDGLIWVLSLKGGEYSDTVAQDRQWLAAEYGAARALQMPRLRLQDVSAVSAAKWSEYVLLDREIATVPFDSRQSDTSLVQSIREPLAEFVKEVQKRMDSRPIAPYSDRGSQ